MGVKQFFFRLGTRIASQVASRFGSTQRKLALGGAAGLALVAVLFGVLFRGEDAQAIAQTLRNPLSVFASRSPGLRADGALYQTKPKLARARRQRGRPIGLVPHERVLSSGRSRPVAPLAFAPVTTPELSLAGAPGPLSAAPPFDSPGYALPGFEVPPFGFGEAPGFAGAPGDVPSSGGPGSGGPGTDTPGTNVPGPGPGPAVPEPATWLMMIVGVGIVGRELRRAGLLRPANPEQL